MTTKKSRQRGKRTYGHGSQKKARGAGGHGGRGFGGSFKHKKFWVKKNHPEHLAKRKFKSLKNRKMSPTLKVVNLRDLAGDAELKGYKILGNGEVKKGVNIKATAFSVRAKEKIEKAGGKAVVFE